MSTHRNAIEEIERHAMMDDPLCSGGIDHGMQGTEPCLEPIAHYNVHCRKCGTFLHLPPPSPVIVTHDQVMRDIGASGPGNQGVSAFITQRDDFYATLGNHPFYIEDDVLEWFGW